MTKMQKTFFFTNIDLLGSWLYRSKLNGQKTCLPFNAHGRQSQNGTDGRNILHVVNKFAKENTKGPRVRKQFGHLQNKKTFKN